MDEIANPFKEKFVVALTGPAGTGKTTLMYEVVAGLRETGIEAVGVTERVRVMPNLTHKELMESPAAHVKLFLAQLDIETRLNERKETEVIVLDRCLVDYVLLARQTADEQIDERMTKKTFLAVIDAGLDEALRARGFTDLAHYVSSNLDLVVMPALLNVSERVKVRPEKSFRQRSQDYFNGYDWPIPVIKPTVTLRDRSSEVIESILAKMGRADTFRDFTPLEDIAQTARELLDMPKAKIFVSGSMCRRSPTLPSFKSDVDLFIEVTDALKIQKKYGTEALLHSLFGVNVSLTFATKKMLNRVTLKEEIK